MVMIKLAALQNCAGVDVEENLMRIERLVNAAADDGAQLVAMPEFATAYAIGDTGIWVDPHPQDSHPSLQRLCRLAKTRQIWLLAGSLGILAPDGRTFNRSFLLNPEGGIAAFYDKIHMFDVDLAGGESYRESDSIAPGGESVVSDFFGSKIGLSVCYDVRFAYLYRQLAHLGAQILTVPAAFARKTGEAHWHVLLRARAIETGCFVVAPGQCGEQSDGRLKRYGHSLIVGPWGDVLAEASGDKEEFVSAEINLEDVAKARRMVPALKHDRHILTAEVDIAAE